MKNICGLLVLAGFLAASPALAGDKAETRAVVDALFEAFNNHDVEGMMALYHPNVIKMNPENPEPVPGYEYLKANYAGLFQGLPNVHDTVTRVVVEEDMAAVEFTASWGEIDGPKGEVKIATFLKIVDGLIVEDFTYYDQKAFE